MGEQLCFVQSVHSQVPIDAAGTLRVVVEDLKVIVDIVSAVCLWRCTVHINYKTFSIIVIYTFSILIRHKYCDEFEIMAVGFVG